MPERKEHEGSRANGSEAGILQYDLEVINFR